MSEHTAADENAGDENAVDENAADEVDWAWLDEERPDWVPPAVDPSRPSVARIYDYLIGGKDNFSVDRQAVASLPDPDGARAFALANRAFMVRCARQMAEAGIDQYLDLGTGIPTSPSLHEVVRAIHPDAAVVYVDNDPIVMAHARAMLGVDGRSVTLQRDLRDPGAVLDDPTVREVLDFARPIGLMMIAVLHFVELQAAPSVVARYFRALAPGSRIAITALARDGMSEATVASAERAYSSSSAPLVLRTRTQIEELFDGLRVLPPGFEEVYRTDHGQIVGGQGVR